MYQIDIMSGTPVYEQIVEQTEQFVLRGILKPGDQLPSVRSLSLALSINPNTIQKAYTELERRGITLSAPGRGSFIQPDVAPIQNRRRTERLNQLKETLSELKDLGFERTELEALLEKIYTPHKEDSTQ